MRKAIILFSGGLDSILAVKILQKQKVKLLGIFFKSYFFNSEQIKQAKLVAKSMKLPLKIIDFSKKQIKIIRNPKYGYGKNINPCIDCRILMFKQAKKIMKEKNFDFIVTGEVLGQRPMSQNKQTMELIEKQAKLKGHILRPLCAKLLEPSIAEKMKWVAREKMFDIRGRSRKKQIELAKKYRIKKYPNPSGGCLLTDPEFSKRLEKLFKVCAKCQNSDIELLKIGRHLWEGNVKIIIGRNEEENKQIKKLAMRADILIEMKNYTGPLTLIRNYNYSKKKISKAVIEKAKELTQFYSFKARDKKNAEFNVVQSK
jgi:tRNA U34 2-thiouridine synthase MnmA/TrmU